MKTGESVRQGGLRRLVGPVTIACVGMGCAIGSGIFAAPGDVATCFCSPWLILLIWSFFGGLTLAQSLVTAELATRFPKAGGEYQYLKEAYGEFAAFFFGWSFTVFIVGGGAATIAALLGEFAAELLGWTHPHASSFLGAGAIVVVVVVNALGLRTGALAQNALTILKVVAVLGIAIGACVVSGRWTPAADSADAAATASGFAATGSGWVSIHCRGISGSFSAVVVALLSAYWPFTGATDPAKLAEEVRDVRRSLPRALVVSTLMLTAVYGVYNYALMCAVSPVAMAGERSVPALVFRDVTALPISKLILVASIVICLGAISSMFLANVRVLYAMARDGLAFRFLGRMSERQSPVAALMVGGGIACVFVLRRSFGELLQIYFMGSAALFGLTYLSLIVFRRRDRLSGRGFPAGAYRMPGGCWWAGLLVLFEVGVAGSIVLADVQDGAYNSLSSIGMLALTAVLYVVWRRARLSD